MGDVPFLPGPNPPTHLMTDEAIKVLDNYYGNAKLALQHHPDAATRLEFLNDVLTTAVENSGYGPWMWVCLYDPGNPNKPGKAEIRIDANYQDPDEPSDKQPKTIDHAVLERGFRRLRLLAGLKYNQHNDLNAWVADCLQADLLNDAGIMDVVDALNIVEVALFGEVRYS